MEEWTVLHKCCGIDVKHAAASFAALDLNNDGQISREEFLENYLEYNKGTDENHRSAIMFGPYGN